MLRGDEGGSRRFESYPVVTGLEGMAFVGTVSRKDLVRERGRKAETRRENIDTSAAMYEVAGWKREWGEGGIFSLSSPS